MWGTRYETAASSAVDIDIGWNGNSVVEPDMDHSRGDLGAGQAGSPQTRPSTQNNPTLDPPAHRSPGGGMNRPGVSGGSGLCLYPVGTRRFRAA